MWRPVACRPGQLGIGIALAPSHRVHKRMYSRNCMGGRLRLSIQLTLINNFKKHASLTIMWFKSVIAVNRRTLVETNVKMRLFKGACISYSLSCLSEDFYLSMCFYYTTRTPLSPTYSWSLHDPQVPPSDSLEKESKTRSHPSRGNNTIINATTTWKTWILLFLWEHEDKTNIPSLWRSLMVPEPDFRSHRNSICHYLCKLKKWFVILLPRAGTCQTGKCLKADLMMDKTFL